MWTGRFKKQYRNLDPNTQQGGVEAIREIASSVNPASLGTYKPNMGIFAYKIERKCRIIYSIQYKTESWICFGHVIASPHTARSKESQRMSIRKCSVTCRLAVYLLSNTYVYAPEASTYDCRAGSILQGTTEVDSRPRKNSVRRAESRAAKRT